MLTINRIIDLLRIQGKSQNDLAEYLSIGKQVITDWKSGKSESYKKRLPEISEYLNTTIDYLLGKTDQKEKPTETDGLEAGTILLALRDGGVKKRKLTSEQMELIEKMIEQMPQADEDL